VVAAVVGSSARAEADAGDTNSRHHGAGSKQRHLDARVDLRKSAGRADHELHGARVAVVDALGDLDSVPEERLPDLSSG
jgi:hypothetical protein